MLHGCLGGCLDDSEMIHHNELFVSIASLEVYISRELKLHRHMMGIGGFPVT